MFLGSEKLLSAEMDDTQSSLKLTSDAATTRKRRSSILKSQRPPRTPLSEIEFNVATPTDTVKSRRVSFSRRTGVAEFVTNEATTTWKNFYEEHNKSLETSGHESSANAPRQMSIGHIGKRIFDQQFEEIEIVDIGGTLQPTTLAQDFHASLNNLNITQQLASLDCPIDDRKLNVPLHNFELSSLTDHQSKIFGDEVSVPTIPEITNPININFSTLQSIGSEDKCDDLDEIVKDLGRSQPTNIVCPGPFNGDREISEYIEIDLNMTHVGIKSDDYEMSITDTICNPEVQDLYKSISSIPKEKKLNKANDWIVDKENIVINPYVTPKESKNFAVNESSDKILVFDGKKLSVKSERDTILNSDKKDNYRATLLSDLPTESTPRRKTIVLNMNDDLPNFISDSSEVIENLDLNSSKHIPQLKHSVIYSECDLSITQAVHNNVEMPRRKTIVFEDDMGNVSITQAVPAKVIINKQEKRKTVIYDNASMNISVTQALPTNILGANASATEKRKTILYEQDVSFTKALSTNLILNNKTELSQDKTMYYQDEANMSVTQAIPDNIIDIEKGKCSMGNSSNISVTQTIPSNIIIVEDKPINIAAKTYEETDVELTQAVPEIVLLKSENDSEKRKTIVFENDSGDISVTQAIPTNILSEKCYMNCSSEIKTPKIEENISFNKSITHSIQPEVELNVNNLNNHLCNTSNKLDTTTIYNDDVEDISTTQAIPSNIIVPRLSETKTMQISSDHDMVDVTMTCALPANILLQNSESPITDKLFTSTSLHNIKNNMSLLNFNISNKELPKKENVAKQQESELNVSNLSMTKPLPSVVLDMQEDILKNAATEKILRVPKTEGFVLKPNLGIKQDVLIFHAVEHHSPSTIDQNNLTTEEVIKSNIKFSNTSLNIKNKTITKDTDVTASENYLNAISSEKVIENLAVENRSIANSNILSKNNSIAVSGTSKTHENMKIKKSFLNELLDMSNASLDDVIKLDVSGTVSQIIQKPLANEDATNVVNSNESLFVILKDNEDDVVDENVERKEDVFGKPEIEITNFTSEGLQKDMKETPTPEYIEEVEYVQNKIAASNPAYEQNRTSTNRHYESVVSTDLRRYEDDNLDKSNVKDLGIRRGKKSFKNADDTRELLGILSDFTDEPSDEHRNGKLIDPTEIREKLPIETKCEPKRSSFIPKRQSVVLSREDLLQNISMTQAALQQSRFVIDENETIDDTDYSPEPIVIENDKSRRKSVRMSTEVVKTLQFEEEDSIISTCENPDTNISPLRKIAFGEASFMRESKAKVIPTYLKDVSDNIKTLMSDLVKPMADVMPFDAVGLNKSLKKSTSTCSTEIQANLITSSQIDIDAELDSNVESIDYIRTNPSVAESNAVDCKVTHAVTRPIQSITASMEIDQGPNLDSQNRRSTLKSPVKSAVIVFDHFNPLNNILLAPTDSVEAHRYNPIKFPHTVSSDHEKSASLFQDEKNKETDFQVERLSTHYNTESRLSQQRAALLSGDTCLEKTKDSNSTVSNISKPASVDRSTEGFSMEVKDTEVNTVIVMKGNKDLLEANSSLTLVDDALAQNPIDIDLESGTSDEISDVKSSIRVIYKMETEGDLQQLDSDITSNDEEFDEINDKLNTRKRSYSPTKRDESKLNKPTADLTPKPVNKMQKVSNSPRLRKNLTEPSVGSDQMLTDAEMPEIVLDNDDVESEAITDKSPEQNRYNEITVQRVTTEYSRNIRAEENVGAESPESLETSSGIVEMVKTEGVKSVHTSSFTSSKDAREMQDVDCGVMNGDTSRLNCQTARPLEDVGNLSEAYCASVNVVDKINLLSFMGSPECEWEASSGDEWSFRLLRSHLRLTVQLAHAHHNAARSRVRADTPLEAINVDAIRPEVRDTLGAVCIRFACEAMRRECARGDCARAGDFVELLKRCAVIAGVALRWGRVMRDARLHLAYTITPDGQLSLKVANIPLRSVWEVRMRLNLVTEDDQVAAWPRADQLQVCAVLADTVPDVSKLAAAIPQDWRHVPATIWTVFRFLKNKTREGDQFFEL